MLLKIDIIRDAYSKLRISGITVSPSSNDLVLALNRLENMMAEYGKRNICVNYNFQDSPDVNDYHNIEPEYRDSISTMLIGRLPDFGKVIPEDINKQMRASSSFLYSATAVKQQTRYPQRQPLGRGNRRHLPYGSNFMPSVKLPPPECTETFTMFVDDIQDYTEHYDAYLNEGETIATFTIEADNGLTIQSSALVANDINYQIKADGNSADNGSAAWLRVKIVVTTTSGRKDTRVKNFTLIDVEIP